MHMIERTAAVACSKCLTVNKSDLHWYMGKLESGKNSGAQPSLSIARAHHVKRCCLLGLPSRKCRSTYNRARATRQEEQACTTFFNTHPQKTKPMHNHEVLHKERKEGRKEEMPHGKFDLQPTPIFFAISELPSTRQRQDKPTTTIDTRGRENGFRW